MNVHQRIKSQLVCSECGAPAYASCQCGAPAVPAKARVEEYDKEHPGKSTRQAAAATGVSQSEVQRARKAREPSGSPATVTGRDGKTYPAKKPAPPHEATDEEAEQEYQSFLYERACFCIKEMDKQTRQKFFAKIRSEYDA